MPRKKLRLPGKASTKRFQHKNAMQSCFISKTRSYTEKINFCCNFRFIYQTNFK